MVKSNEDVVGLTNEKKEQIKNLRRLSTLMLMVLIVSSVLMLTILAGGFLPESINWAILLLWTYALFGFMYSMRTEVDVLRIINTSARGYSAAIRSAMLQTVLFVAVVLLMAYAAFGSESAVSHEFIRGVVIAVSAAIVFIRLRFRQKYE